MENRRLLLAAVLSLGVLIVWQVLFPPPKTAVVPQLAPVSSGTPAAAGSATSSPVSAGPTAAAPAPAAAVEPVHAESEQTLTIETAEYRAQLSNKGAQVTSFQLKKHKEFDGTPVELVRQRDGWPYPFGLVGPHQESLELNKALFSVEDREGKNGEPRSVTFRYAGPEGRAEKTFTFRPNGPLFDVEVTLPGRTDWGVVAGPGVRNPTPEERKSRFAQHSGVYSTGGQATVLDAAAAKADLEVPGTGLDWAGLEDTYFLAALIPSQPVAKIILRPVLDEQAAPGAPMHFTPLPGKDEITDAQKALSRDIALAVMPGSERTKMAVYWGAKHYQTLASMPYGLERTVKWGTFRILVGPLLAGLNWIYGHVVHNYGWAIILMTFLIKLLLLPLTHKSYVSMKKMQVLNPRMQAIRDKWRPKLKDKKGRPDLEAQRKMNEEINALFKSEGVNPAGGCLPMLLQLPLLYAFYNLLSTAIELRGAPWIGWIHDLSHFDPYYILPIVMGAAQLIQQRMMPASGDAMQRKIFLLMPIFFTVLFLQFPSGLVLYWLVNNVLTIAQQAIYEHLKTRKAAAA
ncbi:MAG: membrane protein insertase YidC [Acidobacteriota bacterium]